MATHVPNPISLYYTRKERLLNNLPFGIKHVLMYHLAQSNEVDMCVLIESKRRNACSWQPFCVM